MNSNRINAAIAASLAAALNMIGAPGARRPEAAAANHG
jgi:hypothetical protein